LRDNAACRHSIGTTADEDYVDIVRRLQSMRKFAPPRSGPPFGVSPRTNMHYDEWVTVDPQVRQSSRDIVSRGCPWVVYRTRRRFGRSNPNRTQQRPPRRRLGAAAHVCGRMRQQKTASAAIPANSLLSAAQPE
jgi:hypothetical protein